jgi:hypothetical protein
MTMKQALNALAGHAISMRKSWRKALAFDERRRPGAQKLGTVLQDQS